MAPFINMLSVVALFTSAVSSSGPDPGQITNLVTFGDSYTDVAHPGDGGTAWPVYAASYGNFTLYPYARSGSTCSNKLVQLPPPAVLEGQVPAYTQDKNDGTIDVNPEKTVYTVWIGTNNIGHRGLLAGNAAQGVTRINVTTCAAVDWIQTLYESGARIFLFQNLLKMHPLQRAPLYARGTKLQNLFMTEMVHSRNEMSSLMLEELAPSLQEAHVGLFDSYGLFMDIIQNPKDYLNGTVSPNVTGTVKSCSDDSHCTYVNGTARDSYLWYDVLHPSEQADRIVAREMAAGIKRTSEKWTTWLS